MLAKSVADEILRLKREHLDDGATSKRYHFDASDRVGGGAFGTVFRARDDEGRVVCVKKLSASSPNLPPDPYQRARALFQEVELLRFLNTLGHPNVLRLVHAFEDESSPPSDSSLVVVPDLIHVTEFCRGGDLFSLVLSRMNSGHFYSEMDAALVIAVVAGGLRHLHSNGVLHRDLKLENLLLRTPLAEDGKTADPSEMSRALVLADLGISLMQGRSDPFEGITVGTFALTAPEVLLYRRYSAASDVWSLGCLLYVLMVGCYPFGRVVAPGDYNNVLQGIVYWDTYLPPHCEAGLSDGAKEVIRGMLKKNPSERMTVAQVLEHPWVKGAAVAATAAMASGCATSSSDALKGGAAADTTAPSPSSSSPLAVASSSSPPAPPSAPAPLLPAATYHNLAALDLERRVGAAAHSVLIGSVSISSGSTRILSPAKSKKSAGGPSSGAVTAGEPSPSGGGFTAPTLAGVGPGAVGFPGLRRALTTLSPIPSADTASTETPTEGASKGMDAVHASNEGDNKSAASAAPVSGAPTAAERPLTRRLRQALEAAAAGSNDNSKVSSSAFVAAMATLFAFDTEPHASSFSWARVFAALDDDKDGLLSVDRVDRAAAALMEPLAPVDSETLPYTGLQLLFKGLRQEERDGASSPSPSIRLGDLVGLLASLVKLRGTADTEDGQSASNGQDVGPAGDHSAAAASLLSELEKAWPGYTCGNFSVSLPAIAASLNPPPATAAAVAASAPGALGSAGMSTGIPPAFYQPADVMSQHLPPALLKQHQSRLIAVGGRKRRRASAELEVGETKERAADVERRRKAAVAPILALGAPSSSSSSSSSFSSSSALTRPSTRGSQTSRSAPAKAPSTGYTSASEMPALPANPSSVLKPTGPVVATEEEEDPERGVDVATALLSLQRLFTQLSVAGAAASGLLGAAIDESILEPATTVASAENDGKKRKAESSPHADAEHSDAIVDAGDSLDHTDEGAGAMPSPSKAPALATVSAAFSDIRVTHSQFREAIDAHPALLALFSSH